MAKQITNNPVINFVGYSVFTWNDPGCPFNVLFNSGAEWVQLISFETGKVEYSGRVLECAITYIHPGRYSYYIKFIPTNDAQ